MADVRIIEQSEITTLSGGEYLVTDSPTAGTKKITPQNLVAAAGGGSGTGVSDDLKAALLQLASKVAYIDDDGQEYYDDLYDALYPTKTLVSISAVYTQTETVYPSTSLNALKADLIVTAHYDDSSTATVTTYTLSGTLAVGTSTVTVSYDGKTTTFNVTVSEQATLVSISAVYTQSGTVYTSDTLDSLKDDLVVTALWSDSQETTVPASDYTLSGTLTVGTSTITVTYEEETDTFNVTVSEALVDMTGSMTNWWKRATQGSITNVTQNGATFTAPSTAQWNTYMFQSPLSLTTASMEGKKVKIEFDLEIDGTVTSGVGIASGIASYSSAAPSTAAHRTKYKGQNILTEGHSSIEFSVNSENVNIDANQYLGIFIYWNADNNAKAIVSNLHVYHN